MTALTVTGVWNLQRKSIEVDPIFWEDLKMQDKTHVTSVVTTDRNPDQLKFYWWIVGEIVKSGAWDGDKDTLDDNTRMRVGFGKWRPIASEMHIVESAYSAAWSVWGAMTGLIAKKSQEGFRAALEAYAKACPPRVVFIPNSIALSRLDGLKFNEYMQMCEKEWAEWLGVDMEALRRHADAPQFIAPEEPPAEVPTEVLTPEKSPPSTAPLSDRLTLLALGLDKETGEEVDAAWQALRGTDEAKDLHRMAPKQVKAILNASRMKAEGQLTQAGFNEIIGKAIDSALESLKAA